MGVPAASRSVFASGSAGSGITGSASVTGGTGDIGGVGDVGDAGGAIFLRGLYQGGTSFANHHGVGDGRGAAFAVPVLRKRGRRLIRYRKRLCLSIFR